MRLGNVPLKHVAQTHTPTMLVHGENDADVPIAEAEQFFVALKDVGVDTIFVRYPREGHGLHETIRKRSGAFARIEAATELGSTFPVRS